MSYVIRKGVPQDFPLVCEVLRQTDLPNAWVSVDGDIVLLFEDQRAEQRLLGIAGVERLRGGYGVMRYWIDDSLAAANIAMELYRLCHVLVEVKNDIRVLYVPPLKGNRWPPEACGCKVARFLPQVVAQFLQVEPVMVVFKEYRGDASSLKGGEGDSARECA